MLRSTHRISQNRSCSFVVWVAVLCLAGPLLAQELQVVSPQPVQTSTDDIPGLPTDQDLADVTVDPALAELVALLDDATFGAREKAMQRLLGGPVNRLQICKMLAGTDLSLEQRHRLLALLRYDLLNAPRGAIGILIDRRKLPNEIIIEQLIENLPAIEVLEPGDRITHLDGRPAPEWGRFRRSIEARKPGAKVSITVERLIPNAPDNVPDNAPDDAENVQLQVLNFELAVGSSDLLLDPATGQVELRRVLTTRARGADQAVDRFAPQPRLIEFRPESTAEAEPEPPTQHGS